MPIYEYQCQKCGKIIEEIHSHSAEVKVTCDCGGECERKVSAFSFHSPLESKSHDFKFSKAMEKAANDREEAAKASAMGRTPYDTMSSPDPQIVDQL